MPSRVLAFPCLQRLKQRTAGSKSVESYLVYSQIVVRAVLLRVGELDSRTDSTHACIHS